MKTTTWFSALFTLSIIFILLLLCPCFLIAQEDVDKKERFEVAVRDIIKAYSEKDAETINQYIHPVNGIYFLLNETNNSYWLHRQNLCLTQACIPSYNFPTLFRQKLLEQRLYLDYTIEYKVDSMQEREGLFVDDENIHLLTKVMRSFRQRNSLEVNKAEERKVWRIESNSRRVALLKADYYFWGGKFIFYLSYLNNNWYLSIIDFND